jgi:hypothetical protein
LYYAGGGCSHRAKSTRKTALKSAERSKSAYHSRLLTHNGMAFTSHDAFRNSVTEGEENNPSGITTAGKSHKLVTKQFCGVVQPGK